MPLRVTAAINRKIGLPNYSSLGASCGVEFELDSMLLQNDPGQLLVQVRSAHAACAKAVNDELARQRNAPDRPDRPRPADDSPANRIHGNGHQPVDGNGTADEQTGQPATEADPPHEDPFADRADHADHAEPSGCEQGNGERATDRQLAFLRQLASQIRGLGFRRLERLVIGRFDVPLCDLCGRDASRLIDTLKAVRAGELPLDDLLAEVGL